MTVVYFRTYGCSLNVSDSEVMQGILESLGFEMTSEPARAEVIVMNSCAVKGPTERKFFRELEQLKQYRKPVVVCGCIAKALPERLEGYSLVGPSQIGHIAEAIEEAMHGNMVRLLSPEHNQRLNLKKNRRNRAIEIIPICSGCLGRCAYCIVRLARGSLHSYARDDILKQASAAISQGVKEIWLTAQDTGCYGMDHKMKKTGSAMPENIPAMPGDTPAMPGDFSAMPENISAMAGDTPALRSKSDAQASHDDTTYEKSSGSISKTTSENIGLCSLARDVADLPGDFMVRIGMMNPNHAIGMAGELASVLKHPKIFRFLHIPVQSGSDEVLKRMERDYTAADFVQLVGLIRKEVPDVTIATDVICGFPGETDEQFRMTTALIDRVKPDAVNISRFFPRPKTEAAEMEQVPGDIVKARSRTMSSVFEWVAHEKNRRWRGWKGWVIVDEEGKDGSWVGRNYAYKPVILDGKFAIGQKVDVEIFDSTKDDLRGKVI